MAAVRGVVGAIAMGTLATALAGCTSQEPEGSPDPSPATSSPTAAESPTSSVSLDVTVFGSKRRIDTYEQIVEAFNDDHPDVEVELSSYPDSATAADAVLTFAGDALGPDVFLVDRAYLPAFVEAGATEPVDTLLEERGVQFGDGYQRVALNAFAANDRLQCMPTEMSPLVVYYNKRLVSRRQLALRGIDLPRGDETWRWDEFVGTARAAAQSDGAGPVKGVYLPAEFEPMIAFIRSAGGEVVDDVIDPTSLTLTSDDALEAVAAVAELARNPDLSVTQAELADRDAVDLFTAGRLGMLVGTRDDLPRLRAEAAFRFEVALLPSFGRTRSTSQMYGFCINPASDATGAAADLVAFAVGSEGSRIAARSGAMVPANLDIVFDDAFSHPRLLPRNPEVYAAAIRDSGQLPYSPAWLEVDEMVDAALRRLFTPSGTDLERTLEVRLEQLNARSQELFATDSTAEEE